jgi:xanthine dehydrogenase molybdopterin-binding subunit B
MKFTINLEELIEAKGASTHLPIGALEAWIANETYAPEFTEVWDEVEAWIEQAEETYIGEFACGGDFAEHLISELSIAMVDENADIVEWVVIDHEATWESALRHDYTELDGFYFRNV